MKQTSTLLLAIFAIIISANFANAGDLQIKTKKKVITDLHSQTEHIIVFKFSYIRDQNGMVIRVHPYAVQIVEKDGKPEETLKVIPGASVRRQISNQDLETLVQQVKQVTPANADPLKYMDALVANGIKIIIASEKLWQGKLTFNDFE